jgi:penicillin-binding protein 2
VKHGPLVVDRITWFASYAPYKNPRYVVVIVVESGASGGGTCAPMAQLIYRAIQERENPKAKPKSENLAAAP